MSSRHLCRRSGTYDGSLPPHMAWHRILGVGGCSGIPLEIPISGCSFGYIYLHIHFFDVVVSHLGDVEHGQRYII